MGLEKVVEREMVGEEGGERVWRRLRRRLGGGGEEKSGVLGKRLQSS